MCEREPATSGLATSVCDLHRTLAPHDRAHLVFRPPTEMECMYSPVVILIAFTSAFALLGLLAYFYGWDSRDGFADQAHRPVHR